MCRRAGLPRLSQKRAPRKRPPQTRLRGACRPLPQVLSRWPGLPNPCDPEPQSQGYRRGARAPIPSLRTQGASVAMVDLGTLLTYRGRLRVIVGVTPMGATPRLLELEDVESGRIRPVEWTDPGLDTSPKQTRDREDPTDEQATD